MIQIQVPATSANLGSGFDALGLALTLYNRVWMEEYDGILISSRDAVPIPTDASNLIFWAASRLYEECGRKMPGLRIIQENHIPMASGLGSSSACIVAGLLGANRLLGSPLGKSDLSHLAAKIEGHPDNTTPAISGGLVASAVEGERVYSISVPVSEKIRFAVFHPPFELKTEQARSVLPRQYSGRMLSIISPIRLDDCFPVQRGNRKPAGCRTGQSASALPFGIDPRCGNRIPFDV